MKNQIDIISHCLLVQRKAFFSDLRDVMEEFGTVDSVKLIIDRDTRRSKGFAFVEMPEDSEAQNAIRDLNGATYEGRQMVVKEALPRN